MKKKKIDSCKYRKWKNLWLNFSILKQLAIISVENCSYGYFTQSSVYLGKNVEKDLSVIEYISQGHKLIKNCFTLSRIQWLINLLQFRFTEVT